MGCRTRVMGNVYDPDREIAPRRGNLSFTSINLPRIAIKAKGDVQWFFEELERKMALVTEQLDERLAIISKKKVKNFPFLMGEGVWLDSEKLDWDESVAEVLKHGTLTVGFIGLAETLDDTASGTVIIRAHGVVPQVIDAARERGLDVVDATCPYVKKVHVAAERLVREGYRVLVVGEPGHPEVEGILGHAGDDAQVVSCAADAEALPLKGKVGLVVQTTQTARNLAEVVASITPRVQELRVINTICAATSERQQAAAALADRCDCMVVVGGKNSGNTRRLAQICADACERTYHIEEASELEAAWFVNARHIGITAGASTPQEHIERAVERIKELCR